jgi:hypothetical protein
LGFIAIVVLQVIGELIYYLNFQLGGPECFSSFSPLACPAKEILPVAILPLA